MPPDHCRNHREINEHCRHCGLAYEQQQRWITDRDAKIRAAREEVAAEIAAETHRRAAAVAACDACDDDGRLASGIVCAHPGPADDHLPPGRAAMRAELAKLRVRAAERAKSSQPQPEPAPAVPGPAAVESTDLNENLNAWAEDDAPDPQEHPDGSEDPPPGDDAAEGEYERDLESWRAQEIPYVTTGGAPSEPIF